jgi:hypothetical protein
MDKSNTTEVSQVILGGFAREKPRRRMKHPDRSNERF